MAPDAVSVRLAPRSSTSTRIVGEVLLDLALAKSEKIDKLRVKCRGKYYAAVQVRQTRTVYRDGSPVQESYTQTYPEERDLVRYDVDLWNTYDSPIGERTDTLTFPFDFTLPPNLPPTCSDLDGGSCSANIAYYIEAVAERPALLSRDRRALQHFMLLPSEPLLPEQLHSDLPNWQGPWRETAASKTVKRGLLFGSPCMVKAQLFVPDLRYLPMFVTIPVKIHVTSFSKLMDADDKVKDPLYPYLPETPRDLDFYWRGGLRVRVQGHDDFYSHTLASIPGFSGSSKEETATDPPIGWHVLDKVWISEHQDAKGKGGKGRWKQEVRCSATVTLNGTPSFSTENITLTHSLYLSVPVSGSDLDVTCPFTLITGLP